MGLWQTARRRREPWLHNLRLIRLHCAVMASLNVPWKLLAATSSLLVGAVVLCAGRHLSRPTELAQARAEGSACSVRGTPTLAKNVELFAGATGEERLARFTGQAVGLRVTVPSQPGTRAAVKSDREGFHIDGYLAPQSVPVFTTRNVPVVADHVWIGGGRQVMAMSASADRVNIELAVGAPIEQTLRATVGCEGLSLEVPSFQQAPISGHARGYLVKKAPLAIRASASGPTVFSFTSEDIKDALLFWSTERSGGAVRVQLTGDVVIDGWASASDLEALKEGEMMDALAPGRSSISAPRLMMQGAPSPIKVPRQVSIRARANDAAAVIGGIDSGAEVLVVETVAGWSSVLPPALHLMPTEGGGFWVKSSELKASESK